MRWILFPREQASPQDMGGKAHALAALNRAGLPIPGWFVVRPDACLDSVGETGRRQLAAATEPAAIQALLANVRPDQAIMAEITASVEKLCSPGGFVAVRSSAADKDGAEHSFAGQLESYLFVAPDRVAEKVAAVWRSGFSERILAYRQKHGLPLVPRPPAELVQRMVDAEAAGVAFSADPVSGRRGVAVVSAVFSLGTSVVSGEANADTWRINRAGKVIESSLGEKTILHRPDPKRLYRAVEQGLLLPLFSG